MVELNGEMQEQVGARLYDAEAFRGGGGHGELARMLPGGGVSKGEGLELTV